MVVVGARVGGEAGRLHEVLAREVATGRAVTAGGVVGHAAGARPDARVGCGVLLAEVAAIGDELWGEAPPQGSETWLLVAAEGLLGVAWSGVGVGVGVGVG